MPTLVGSITRAATRRSGEPLNCISFGTHESYQSGLAQAGHDFYLVQGPGIKTWNSSYRPLPDNHFLLDPDPSKLKCRAELDFDLVLSQNKAGQYPIAASLSRQLHIPLVCLEHCLPSPDLSQDTILKTKSLRGHVNVFISEYSRKAWGWNEGEAEVIHHGVDTETFCHGRSGREGACLSVVNDWRNRDVWCGYKLWEQATRGLPVRVLGDNPGLSKAAPSVAALAESYRTSLVFVNTSLVSPIPSALLEAMASGCAVVSTGTCMIPEVITHGENGLLADDAAGIRKHAERLLANPQLAAKLGEAARRTMLERFSMARFAADWDALLRRAADIPYTGVEEWNR